MKTITAQDLCDWLKLSVAELHDMRLRRDGTKFPPPCDFRPMRWYEADVTAWVSFLADWRDCVAAGDDPRAALDSLAAPSYLAIEPEILTNQTVPPTEDQI